MFDICEFYHCRWRSNKTYLDKTKFSGEAIGECWGTKNCLECYCGGDKSKCDFYKNTRGEYDLKMNTIEMWRNALTDGKTYQVKYGYTAFQRDKGLFNINNGTEMSCHELLEDDSSLSDLMNIQWIEVKENLMTKSEAEKKFNIKIIG